MKKALSFILLSCFLCLACQTALCQQEKKAAKKEETQQISTEDISEKMPRRTRPSYTRGGRKDPFRDLLSQQETKAVSGAEGPQVSVENVVVIGIVKARGQFTAIVTGPEDFPLFVKVGHKFSDGYIHSIDENKVVFRKTQERGSPLFKPKDIVKEINTEERR